MSRRDDLSLDDRRIWARVAGTVTPSRKRKALLITGQNPASSAPAAEELLRVLQQETART